VDIIYEPFNGKIFVFLYLIDNVLLRFLYINNLWIRKRRYLHLFKGRVREKLKGVWAYKLYWRYVLRYNESFLTIFSLKAQQKEVRLVAITIQYLSTLAYTPFHFSRTLPLKIKIERIPFYIGHDFLLFEFPIGLQMFPFRKNIKISNAKWSNAELYT